MATTIDLKYDPEQIARAMHRAASSIAQTSNEADKLGQSAVNAATGLDQTRQSVDQLAESVASADKEVFDLNRHMDELAEQTRIAKMEFGDLDEAMQDAWSEVEHDPKKFEDEGKNSAIHFALSFGRTASTAFKGVIGTAVGSAIGTTIAAASEHIVGGLIEMATKAKGETQEIFSDAAADSVSWFGGISTAFYQNTLGALRDATAIMLEEQGVLKEGYSQKVISAGLGLEIPDTDAMARSANAKMEAGKAREREAQQARVVEQQERLNAVIEKRQAELEAINGTEEDAWAATLKSVEQVDEWYKSTVDGAEAMAASLTLTSDKAAELDRTLAALAKRKIDLQKEETQKNEDAIKDKEQAEKEFRDAQERMHKDKIAKEEQAEKDSLDKQARMRQEQMDKIKGLVTEPDTTAAASGEKEQSVAEQALGAVDPEDVTRTIRRNRRSRLASGMAEAQIAAGEKWDRKMEGETREKLRKEIYGQPASVDETAAATGELAGNIIQEAGSRAGVDQQSIQFMQTAVQTLVQQAAENEKNAQMIKDIRTELDGIRSGGRKRAQVAGTN